MPIDPAEWIEGNLEGVHRRGGSYEADCPFCGKSGHLYVHAEQGYFACFAQGCDSRGSNLVKLVAEVEGLSVAEAWRIVFRGGKALERKRPESADEVRVRLQRLLGAEPQALIDIAPPSTMVPVWDGCRWRMPEYLSKGRGLSRRLARRYGLGFCGPRLCRGAPQGCEFPIDSKTCVEVGRCRYAGRVILPFECPNGRNFTTRAAVPDLEPKYLNPPGLKGRLLYGWQSAIPGGDLVLVEGPFDVLRLVAHGLAAVAIMGLSISDAQYLLLAQLRPSSITLMLDAGVETEALDIAAKIFDVSSDTFVSRLPEGVDPGSSTKAQAWEAFRSASRYSGARELSFTPTVWLEI